MDLGNFDIFILLLFLFCIITGLMRGFIRELFSLLNWVLSFYFLTLVKPFFIGYFAELIKIPFLSDIILNISIFVIILIVLSIISKYIAELLKKIMPYNLDMTLGFLFGVIKAYVILILVTSTIEVLYNGKEPKILSDSAFNKIFYKNDITNDKIRILLGDFLNEKDQENQIEKEEKNDNNSIDIIEEKIDDINNNNFIENNIEDLNDKVESILEKL